MEPRSRGASMPLSRLTLVVALAIALGIWCGGCLALAIPEVAYEGYKYEHNKDSKPKAAQSASSANRDTPHTNDASIE